ncbi:MAG: NAD-dependent epimerase/dehydratase family protein [Chthoniobacterales bacterium]
MTAEPAHANPLAEDLDHILAHTRSLWEPLRGRRIFVTGGTGFFGRWLLESFAYVNRSLALSAHMVVLSRDPEKFALKAPHLMKDRAIQFVRGDVRSFTVADARAQNCEAPFDFVIHAATEASAQLNADEPLRMFDTIISGTRNALEFAVATGAKRFLLTSSGAVYGPQPSEMTHIPEDFAGGPDCTQAGSAYGEGKRAAELLCAFFRKQHGIEPLIARCFAFVGPFLPLDTHFAIGNFIRDALAGGPIRIGGDGTPLRSYLHTADLAIWLWTILFRGTPMRPYNVGSAKDLTIGQLATTVRDAMGGTVEIVTAKTPDPKGAITRYVPDNTRATSELHLKEWVDLPDAIRKTARFASLS